MEAVSKTLRSIKESAEQSKRKCYRCRADSDVQVCGPCVNRQMEQSLETTGIPLGLYKPSWEIPEWAKKYTESPRGLFLHGAAGVGKSATCALLLREKVRSVFASWDGNYTGHEVSEYLFISYPMFIMRLQDAYIRGETDKTAYRMIQAAASAKVLVIDDLGAEKLTDFVRQSTYALINEREQWRRTTYITSNWSVRQIADQIDVRVASRIVGLCDVLEMKGKDRRAERDD